MPCRPIGRLGVHFLSFRHFLYSFTFLQHQEKWKPQTDRRGPTTQRSYSYAWHQTQTQFTCPTAQFGYLGTVSLRRFQWEPLCFQVYHCHVWLGFILLPVGFAETEVGLHWSTGIHQHQLVICAGKTVSPCMKMAKNFLFFRRRYFCTMRGWFPFVPFFPSP